MAVTSSFPVLVQLLTTKLFVREIVFQRDYPQFLFENRDIFFRILSNFFHYIFSCFQNFIFPFFLELSQFITFISFLPFLPSANFNKSDIALLELYNIFPI